MNLLRVLTPLFLSLATKEKGSQKASWTYDGKYAIYCDRSYGLTLVSAFRITSKLNVNQTSYSNFGRYYAHDDLRAGTNKANDFLAR